MQSTDLIKYIAWYATQQGIKLTTNRLVKFLYLADLYYARIKDGKQSRDFPGDSFIMAHIAERLGTQSKKLQLTI